jgi:hypothetical protein
MRKTFLLVSLVAVAIAAVPATVASAKTETRLRVIHVEKSGHPAGHNTLVERGKLLQPTGRHRVVGRDRIKLTLYPRRHAARIRLVAHLRGRGSLKAKGRIGRKNNNPWRIPITGGTREFDGATGTLKARGLTFHHGGGIRRTLLTFHIVQ